MAVRFGGWTGVRCCVLGPVQLWAGRVGSWAFAFSLSYVVASVASHVGGGGSGGLWDGGARLCLGSWLWSWISRGPLGALGLVMALSFPSFFMLKALWFGLGLSFDWSFPLRVPFCHNCIFVLQIFNKLMKNKKTIIFLTTEKTGRKPSCTREQIIGIALAWNCNAYAL